MHENLLKYFGESITTLISDFVIKFESNLVRFAISDTALLQLGLSDLPYVTLLHTGNDGRTKGY